MNASLHLSADLIERWRSRKLAPAEVLAVSDHLHRCPECAAALTTGSSPERAAGAIDRLLEPDRGEVTHLTADELERWVDGAADPVETEIVTSHLAVCDVCRAEAEDLRRFAATLRGRGPAGRWLPWLAAAAVAAFALGLWLYVAARKASLPAPPTLATEAPAPTPPAPPTAATVLRDGPRTITVRPDGTVEGVPEDWRQDVAAILRRPELAIPAAALAVARSGEAQRSEVTPGAQEVRLLGPLSRVVLEARPPFRWAGPPDAEYRVEVYDSRFALVAASGQQTETSWRPRPALPRGELLTWKVTVIREGVERAYPVPPAPPAVFQVVSLDATRGIEAARSTGSRLVGGLALWRAGLVEEAAAELAAWAAENPESSTAQRLAASSARGAAAVRADGGRK